MPTITPERGSAHMGTVNSGIRTHRVRIACQHWQPKPDVNDCRFRCGEAGAP